jgi:hypothetical protein
MPIALIMASTMVSSLLSSSSCSTSAEIEAIGWEVDWCRAFPTLIPDHIYNYHDLRLLAWRRLFPRAKVASPSQAAKFQARKQWKASLGYGEILPETVFDVLDIIRTKKYRHTPIKTVFDLGSGDGKVLLANALAVPPETKLVGMEIVPDLHEKALERLQLWNDLSPLSQDNNSRVEFLLADFTTESNMTRILTEADLIWIHGTVFEPKLFALVQDICEACDPGTLFVLISQPLEESEHIETLEEGWFKMSWGLSIVFLQRHK